jgi:hypothetical protein
MSTEDTTVLPAATTVRAPGVNRVPLIVASLVAVAALSAAALYFLRASTLEQSLAAAEARAADAERGAERAREDAKNLKIELSARDAELATLREAPLPVDVTFRAGRPGTGFIAQLDNRSDEPMLVEVAIRRGATGEDTTVHVEIPARGLGEIGPGTGWAFASGDTLTVRGGTHRPLQLRVP